MLKAVLPRTIPLSLGAAYLLAELVWEYRPLRPAVWLSRTIAIVYGLYFVIFLVLLLRCFIPVTGLVGPLLLVALVAACVWKHLSTRLTLLLFFNAALVIAAGLYAYPLFSFHYLPAPNPEYQTAVLTFDRQSPTCDNADLSPADFRFAPRQLHFTGDKMIAVNGYRRAGLYLNAMVTAWPPDGRAKCLLSDYCGDLIRDPDADRYYAVNYHFREVWLLDGNLRRVQSVRLTEQILDLFLLPDGRGGKQLYVIAEGGIHMYRLHPDTLNLLELSSPFFSIQMDTIVDPEHNAMYGATFGPWIAARFNLDNPRQYRRAALGLGSWGLDRDPVKNQLYVSDFFLGRITRIDAHSMAVRQSRVFLPGWRAVAFDPKRRLVYVGHYFYPRILVLDENLNRRAVLETHGAVRNLELAADRNTLYVACLGGVFAIDLDRAMHPSP